jgi:hypothetical protein
MEGERQEIRVAQVSLVDGYGKEIGIYDDDPGWWLNSNRNPENDSENGKVSPSNESTSSKSKLIKKKEEFDNNVITNQMKQPTKMSKFNMIGETPLHIAIMYDDLNTIKYLIETKGYNINQRCVGNQFVSGFNYKEAAAFLKYSKYDELAYYGEYPLALAGCFSNKEVYDYLIEQGGDPNLQGYIL